MMKICSRIWRYSHPHKMDHNRRLWPYVRQVVRDKHGVIEDIKVRFCDWNLLLTSYAEVPRPNVSSVHLILSGPSIKEIDYNQLALPCVMGVNGSIALRRQYDVPFHYYVIIDDSFVRDRTELVKDIVAQDLTLFARVSVLKEINLRISADKVKCRFVAVEEIDTPAYLPRPNSQQLREKALHQPSWKLFDADRYQGFSTDPQSGLFSARTVAYDALQILVWLGFKEIYIHGLDLNNVKTAPRFYETKDNCVSSTLEQNFREYIEPSFKEAAVFLRERKVDVLNLSRDSAISEYIFPKGQLNAISSRKK